jgi:flagellar protein FliO/FliZ
LRPPPPSSSKAGRTSSMKRFLLAGGVAATTFIWQVESALAAGADHEKKPVNLPLDQVNEQATTGNSNSASGGLMRTFFGLLVVIAIIYGLYWILKKVKAAQADQAKGTGLHAIASLPLGANRSLHMIRAGREIVLVGVAEHGVAPIRSYTEEEAFEAGLISLDDDDDDATGSSNGAVPNPITKAGFAKPGAALKQGLEKLRQRTVR